jgi:hypothetical protein
LQREKAVACVGDAEIVPIPCDAKWPLPSAWRCFSRCATRRWFKHGLRLIEALEHRLEMRAEMRRIRHEMQELERDWV